jgi:hypothetical protein
LGKVIGFVRDGALVITSKNNSIAANKEFEEMTSSLILHSILNQEAAGAKSFKMNHIMDTVIETVDFIHTSVFNHREFVALLEEVENK